MLPVQLKHFAAKLSSDLLSGSILNELYKSGIFIAGAPVRGANTFLFDCLARCLTSAGAKVARLHAEKFCGCSGLQGVSGEISAQTIGNGRGQTWGLLSEVVLSATSGGATLVVLIEGIDVWVDTEEGMRTLRALKSCRDAVNLTAGRTGKFVVVGIGDSTKVVTLTRDSAQAFYGAALIAVPGRGDLAPQGILVDLQKR